MSCAMVLARRVMNLLFSSVRLDVGRPIILSAVFDAYEFGPAGKRYRTAQLDNYLVRACEADSYTGTE